MKKNMATINDIKVQMLQLKGQEVKLYVNRGRRKVYKFEAVVDNVYASVFTVRNFDTASAVTKTYSYNDVLCGEVKIIK